MKRTGEMMLYVIGASLVFGLFYAGVGIYALAKQLCYKMAGINVTGFRKSDGTTTTNPFGATWADLDLTIKIVNPSYLTVLLTKYSLIISINGYPVAVVDKNQAISLLKGTAQNIHILVSINLKSGSDLFKNGVFLAEFASKQYDQIVLNVAGTFTGSLFNVPVSTKINTSMSMQDILNSMEAPKTAPQC